MTSDEVKTWLRMKLFEAPESTRARKDVAQSCMLKSRVISGDLSLRVVKRVLDALGSPRTKCPTKTLDALRPVGGFAPTGLRRFPARLPTPEWR